MKIKIIFLLAIFLITSCSNSYWVGYNIGLKYVEKPENTNIRFGKSKIERVTKNGKVSYVYEDDIIKIAWFPGRKQFNFLLRNKSEHSLKILWDEAAYIDQSGVSHRVIHSRTKYVNKEKPQTPTIVAKNSFISDLVVPSDNIYFSNYSNRWITYNLLPSITYETEKELEDLRQKIKGTVVQILLPIEIKGTINDYLFTFEIIDLY